MTVALLLTPEELIALTGYRQHRRQLEWLKARGVRFFARPDGSLVVGRQALEPPAPPPEARPSAPPVPIPFEETPLGRWQARQRAAGTFDPTPPPPKLTAQVRRALQHWKKERRASLVRHHAAKRRVVKLKRMPPWADQDAIKAIYRQARALTKATGTVHHVDHDIPLQGKLVSGLHVETNLQILTGRENSRKRNRYEVE